MTTGHYVCKVKRKIDKEDIIKSGYDLFYDKGYGVTGISEITSKIGIPKGSFYNHFKSKEEFGVAVLDYYVVNNLDFLNASLLSEAHSPLTNLKKFFLDYIDLQENVLGCSKGCLMSNMTMELADRVDPVQESAKIGFEKASAVFELCLENAVLSKEINEDTETSLLANFIVNSWQGASIRMKADKTTEPLWMFYRILFDKLLK